MNFLRLLVRTCTGIAAAGITLAAHATPYTEYEFFYPLQGPMIFSTSASWGELMYVLSVQGSLLPPSNLLSDPGTIYFEGGAPPQFSSPVFDAVGAQNVTTSAQDAINGTTSIVTHGGIRLDSAPNFAGSGGEVMLSNFTVDLPSKTVVADVTANGTSMGRVDMFSFTTMSGPTAVLMMNFDGLGETAFNFSVPNLLWTQDGQNAIANGLRFNATGEALLASVTDAGSLSTSPVPEPTSAALLGAGVAAFVLARRSTRRRQPVHPPAC